MCSKRHISQTSFSICKEPMFRGPLFAHYFARKRVVPKNLGFLCCYGLAMTSMLSHSPLRKSQPFGPLFGTSLPKRGCCLKIGPLALHGLNVYWRHSFSRILLAAHCCYVKLFSIAIFLYRKNGPIFWTFRNNYEKFSLSRITCNWSLHLVTMNSLWENFSLWRNFP